MKKLCMLLALLLCVCLVTASAEEYDLSFVRENSKYYELDVEIEDGTGFAFVESVMQPGDLDFVHKYDSQTKYSFTQFDILVIDYLSPAKAYPVHRLWIYYSADNYHQYITAVTFNINGTKYTFSGVADASRYEVTDGVYQESLLIKFDWDNLDFLAALEKLIPEDLDNLDSIKIPMTLHGVEDITVDLDGRFLLDFMFIRLAMLITKSSNFLVKADGSSLKVTEGLVE